MQTIHGRQIPVLIGQDYEHAMCEAEIIEDNDGGIVTITMTAKGDNANALVALLTAMEPMALSFVGIPVTPRSLAPKET